MVLSIIICATKNFQYALINQARCIKQNLLLAKIEKAHIILITDKNDVQDILDAYKRILGNAVIIHHIPLDIQDGSERYKEDSQLRIAQMYTAGFDYARYINSTHVFTLEADCLPNPSNLRCMRDAISFDDSYYNIAFCPYVSSGMGGIMGGRGDQYHHILPNIYDDELEIPDVLQNKIDFHKKLLIPNQEPSSEWRNEMNKLNEEIKNCKPKGNVFYLNSLKYKKRGWLEFAAPGIGKGAILESDWMPMGCNLFSQKALNLVDFLNYEGRGTQDLHLFFKRLKQHNIRICVIPHSTCSHVIRRPEGLKIISLHHEEDGEYAGHLRQTISDFYSHEPGELSRQTRESKLDDFSI